VGNERAFRIKGLMLLQEFAAQPKRMRIVSTLRLPQRIGRQLDGQGFQDLLNSSQFPGIFLL
jgi:hypothetical protein